MPNFLKIPQQIKRVSILGLDFDRAVCMPAISYSSSMYAVPRTEQLLEEERTYAKL